MFTLALLIWGYIAAVYIVMGERTIVFIAFVFLPLLYFFLGLAATFRIPGRKRFEAAAFLCLVGATFPTFIILKESPELMILVFPFGGLLVLWMNALGQVSAKEKQLLSKATIDQNRGS